ncbi:signal transduction protein with Nacht domain protein, partial [Streptomyces sp. NPDC127084]
ADPSGSPRSMALRLLAEYFPQRPEALALLVDRATADPDGFSRSTALRLLAVHFPQEPETLALLVGRVVADPDESLRYMALHLLAEHFPHRSEALAGITDRAGNDPEPELRLQAFQAWAAMLPPDDVYEAGRRALEDAHLVVRAGGSWVLAFGCPRDLRARAMLHEHAQNDLEPEVRSAASDALIAAEMLASAEVET